MFRHTQRKNNTSGQGSVLPISLTHVVPMYPRDYDHEEATSRNSSKDAERTHRSHPLFISQPKLLVFPYKVVVGLGRH
jgi:hypothetical protein